MIKEYKTGHAVSNIALKSQRGVGIINHLFRNWSCTELKPEEKEYRKNNSSKNSEIFNDGLKSEQDLKKRIQEISNSVDNKLNKNETKEVVFSFPIREDMTADEQKAVAKDLIAAAIRAIKKQGPDQKALFAAIHFNEPGKPHVHLLFDNTHIDKKTNKRKGGFSSRIKKPQLRKLQKDFEPEYMEIMKKHKIAVISQQQNKEFQIQRGKRKLNIGEFKKAKLEAEQKASAGQKSNPTEDMMRIARYVLSEAEQMNIAKDPNIICEGLRYSIHPELLQQEQEQVEEIEIEKEQKQTKSISRHK